MSNPSELIERITSMATEAAGDGPVTAILEGSFAMYPTPDGGMHIVFAVAEGPMAGEHRMNVSPTMLRGAIALSSGNGMWGKAKALLGKQ